jgi:MoaA/NifB/PqqE/SkfB family radical SAM enzyme
MERLRLVREVTSELGLRVLVVTNGTVVTNTVKAREALALVDDISVSFDDYRSFLHDALRGGTGSFNRAKEAVRYLSSVRNGQKLYLMCLVHRSNLDCLVRFFDLAVELGADRAKLNFLMPTFGRNKGTDGFFQLNAPTSSRDFLASLRAIEAKHGIVPNPLWVDARVSYLDGLASSPNLAVGWSGNIGSLKPICGAWERNVHVDRHGVMRLCWGPEFPSRKWERPGDVKRFWTETPRECYQLCHKACGVSHSVHRDSFSRG